MRRVLWTDIRERLFQSQKKPDETERTGRRLIFVIPFFISFPNRKL
jgi:hypothetical protein